MSAYNPKNLNILANRVFALCLRALRGFIVFVVMVLFLFYSIGSFRIIDANISNKTDYAHANEEKIRLPFSAPSAFSNKYATGSNAKSYIINVSVIGYSLQNSIWRISSNDCIKNITVNKAPVFLERGQTNNFCKVNKGITLDLYGYMRPGENTIGVELLDNNGGTYDLGLRPVFSVFGYDLYRPRTLKFLIYLWIAIYILHGVFLKLRNLK